MKDSTVHPTPSGLSPAGLFGDLPVLRLRLEYGVDDPELLPDYLGSSWRGVIGWQMQRLCCPYEHRRECLQCVIREHCPYFLLYERESDLSGFQNAPRPYIFLPEKGTKPDCHLLNITLLGTAARVMPLLWKAVQEAADTGLGRERVGFWVHDWWEERPGQGWIKLPRAESYRHVHGGWSLRDCLRPAPPLPWRVQFAPPLRLRAQGKNLTAMDWPFFLHTLARRLEMLHVIFHQGRPLGRELWLTLGEGFAQAGKMEQRLTWQDWSRWSNRQRRKVPMGGLVGEGMVLKAWPDLWDWLQLAERVHVGKGAAMGLGGISLSTLPAPAAQGG